MHDQLRIQALAHPASLHNAFPVKWEGPEFDASSNDVALEAIELAVERIDRVGG